MNSCLLNRLKTNCSMIVRRFQSTEAEMAMVFDRYLYKGKNASVVGRRIEFPSGTKREYEFVQENHSCTLTFAWHQWNKSVTLVEEYFPTSNDTRVGLISGNVLESDNSPLEAAQRKMQEETTLTGGHWHWLLKDHTTYMQLSRYCNQHIFPFLVVDPTFPDENVETCDTRAIHRYVSVNNIMPLLVSGDLSAASSITSMLSLGKLQSLGIDT
eukprot:GHVL01024557.1.p1 GENE.GHVL01024557.1~~GHVL01024557.1.p1  ORF type:complete len:213 (+),score=31.52 GHVL01024557.1:150-788(+)